MSGGFALIWFLTAALNLAFVGADAAFWALLIIAQMWVICLRLERR